MERAPKEVAEFLAKNHYLGAIKRGIAWQDEFGVIVFGHPTSRQLPQGKYLELMRWCLLGAKNGGSKQWASVVPWIKKRFPEVTTVISYSDPSVGHTGALYRACNWLWAPTWHRLRPPPTGNGKWKTEKIQSVKDRWVFPIRPDPEREKLLLMKDDAILKRHPWARFTEPKGADFKRFKGEFMAKPKTEKAAHAERAHSRIGASSHYRWSECPASVKLCETLPPGVSSVYAEEGTKAHELAEMMLKRELTGKMPKDYLSRVAQAPTEMRDAVQVYISFVMERAKNAAEVSIEHRFDLSELHPGLFGTADCVIYDAKKKHLLVADYKHGAGISVSPERNTQLMYYGLGALLTLGYPCATVELAIIQPRCPHPEGMIRSWTLPAHELIEFSADLVDAAKRTESDDAPFKAGEHCRFCPAAGVCPELGKNALKVASEEFAVVEAAKPGQVATVKLAEALELIPRLESFISAVRELAYREALAGRAPKGWKLVQKRGTRQWAVPDGDVADALVEVGLDVADIYDAPSLKSVAQMEKLVGKKEFPAVCSSLVKMVSSGATLVPESDPRPAIPVGAEAAAIEFSKIED